MKNCVAGAPASRGVVPQLSCGLPLTNPPTQTFTFAACTDRKNSRRRSESLYIRDSDLIRKITVILRSQHCSHRSSVMKRATAPDLEELTWV